MVKYDLKKQWDQLKSEKRELQLTQAEMNEKIENLKLKIHEKTSECDSLSLRITYYTDREREEQNMYGRYKLPQKDDTVSVDDESKDEATIINTLEDKHRQIEKDFEILKKKFMDIAEVKMDKIKEGEGILEEMDRICKLHIEIKDQNSELKNLNEILNTKLDAKNKLNEHLEEKWANILIEKEDTIIKLKAEIIALKSMSNKSKDKFAADLKVLEKSKSNLERENRDLEEKLLKVQKDYANYDSDFKKNKVEMKKLNDEFKKHKKYSKELLNEKNLLIKDYEERVTKLNQIKQQQVEMLNREKEDLENELNVAKNQNKIFSLKENFYKNKAEKLLIQKEFLVKQIDNNLETMNNDYNKLQDQETQKDFMISIKKSNKNIQEVYFTCMNNLKYFKEVIDFMNFDELNNSIMEAGDHQDEHSVDNKRLMITEEKESSMRSDSKPSKSRIEKSHRDDKDIEHHDTSNLKLSLDIKAIRKHPTTQNVVNMNLSNLTNGDNDYFNASEPFQFKKDLDFYFTHYWQELLNSMISYIIMFYESKSDLEIPDWINNLAAIVKEKSDNDLSAEINETFFSVHKTLAEKIIKEDKEHSEKLERQKANMIKEMNDLRKYISKLEKAKDKENIDENDISDSSISGNSSGIKTPRSEDMITIERLKKKNDDLEEKLKDVKKTDKEKKVELLKKISSMQEEIEDKTYKIQTLKNSLWEQFKQDIEKLNKSYEIQKRDLERTLLNQKSLEIDKIAKLTDKQYQQRIVSLENSLEDAIHKCNNLEKTNETNLHHRNLEVKHDNENKLKILKENKGTFSIAFDSISLRNSPRRMEEQLAHSVAKTLDISVRDIRLISINYDDRLENDRNTSLTIFLYEIVSDVKFKEKKLAFPPLSWLNKLRVQIRDGTSLLYDLNPIYVGINIGSIFGLIYEKPIDEYYLLKREGIYFGNKQLLVTLLKHPTHYFKIIAYDVSTNEDYSLSLDTHDILELAQTAIRQENENNGMPYLHEILENDIEISNIIMDSLSLIKKESELVLLWEQRLYFDTYSMFRKSVTDKFIEEELNNEQANLSIQPSDDEILDDKEVQQINTDRGANYVQTWFSRFEKCSQTTLDNNILNEEYINVLSNSAKDWMVGMYDVRYTIKKGYHSKNLLITFTILIENKKYVLRSMIFKTEKLNSKESNEIDIENVNNFTLNNHCAYLGYIRPDDENWLIITIEQFISPDGLHIKLHDLHKKASTIVMLSKQKHDSSKEFEYVEVDQDLFEFKPDSIRNEMSELFSLTSAVLNPNDLIMIPKLSKRDDREISVYNDEDHEGFTPFISKVTPTKSIIFHSTWIHNQACKINSMLIRYSKRSPKACSSSGIMQQWGMYSSIHIMDQATRNQREEITNMPRMKLAQAFTITPKIWLHLSVSFHSTKTLKTKS